MINSQIHNFIDDFRPYNEQEANVAVRELENSEIFINALNYFLPDKTFQETQKYVSQINSIRDFQISIMHRIIRNIIDKTSGGLSFSGFENIDKNKKYDIIYNKEKK